MHDFSIHKLGQAVGLYVAKKVSSIEQAEYLAFGAEILLGSIVKLCILFFIAAVLNIVREVIILLVVTGLIRTLSGGAHCSAYYRCLVTSVSILTALGYAVKAIHPFIVQFPTIVMVGIIVLSIYLYWRYAPQAPLNKPFENRTEELAFRWYTLISVVTISIISIIFGASSLIGWTMVFALLWQAFTLTSVGHSFIGSWDVLLTFKKKGGGAEC